MVFWGHYICGIRDTIKMSIYHQSASAVVKDFSCYYYQ